MGKRKSLNKQFFDKLESLKRIGESRHKAKREYMQKNKSEKENTLRAEGIYSYKTYQAYKQTLKEFSTWIKENHKEIRNIEDITKKIQIEYLNCRTDKGLSAWTLDKDKSAFNKVFNDNIAKNETNISKRKVESITRSRGIKEHDKRYDPNNYYNQILIAKAFGCRRESIYIKEVRPKDFPIKKDSFYFYQGKLYLSVIEKGGKYRGIPALKQYQNEVIEALGGQNNIITRFNHLDKEQYMDKWKKSEYEIMFNKYSSLIDNHSFRREYAQNRYKEIIEEIGECGLFYRGYDKEALNILSVNLGHGGEYNRMDTTINNYLK